MIFLTTGILIITFYFLIFEIIKTIKKELPSLMDDGGSPYYQMLNRKLKEAEIKNLKEREEELLKWNKVDSNDQHIE